MEKRQVRRSRFWACLVASLAAVTATCSSYPVDTSGRNLLELQSVWQYLKVYSIWQDSVPLAKNAFIYSTPESLLASVIDTLHRYQYTRYVDTTPVGPSAMESGAARAEAASPVYFARISARTGYVRIFTFDRADLFDSFLVAVPFLARFQNIMLDLRSNTGGSIAMMDSVIEYFLPVNTPYIEATYRSYDSDARSASTRIERWTTKHVPAASLTGKNIVILMNRFSASASEMLAAGIKDGRRLAGLGTCKFVGDTSFGKGIGQVVVNRKQFRKPDIQITFLRVTRACGCADSVYHRIGMAPDTLVVNSVSAIADTAQFFAAFNVLEPGARPDVIIFTQFLAKSIAQGADHTVPAISDFEN
jgi:C-terminal processing protease CtpA/Prc